MNTKPTTTTPTALTRVMIGHGNDSRRHGEVVTRVGVAGAMLALWLLLTFAAGCSCGGEQSVEQPAGPDNNNNDEQDEEPRDPFAERLLAEVHHLASTNPAERDAARDWIRQNASEAAPRLVAWLADDPGLGMPVQHMLYQYDYEETSESEQRIKESYELLAAGFEWARLLEMREVLPRLVDLSLNPVVEDEIKEAAREIVADKGDTGLEAAHAYMLEDPRRARDIIILMRAFPRDQVLRFWMLKLGDDEAITRESARRWVDVFYQPGDRVSAELVFEVIPVLPFETEVDEREEVEGDVFYPHEHLIMKIKGATRLSPGDDPWLIEAIGRCFHRLPTFKTRTVARIGEVIHEQRRRGAMIRLERWLDENQPQRGDPEWLGHQQLRGISQQVRINIERWQEEALRPDVVIEPGVGTEVPYGPDDTAEMVLSPVTGEWFPASQLTYEPEADRWPGLFGGDDDALREQLREGLDAETWWALWPEHAFGRPPVGVDEALRDRIDEWPLEVHNYFAYSPVMEALYLCGAEHVVEPLQQALADYSGNWRVWSGATMVLGRFGALPDPRTLEPLHPAETLGEREASAGVLESARNWQALSLATALSFDRSALGRDGGDESLRADSLVRWLEDLAPWLRTSTRMVSRNPRYVEARLASAWAWALLRQEALAQPHVWDVPLENWLEPLDERLDVTDVELEGTTWAQLAMLHAWLRLADEHEALRDVVAIRLLGAETVHVRSALDQLNWRRHPWILDVVSAELERDPSAAQPVWIDVLKAFGLDDQDEVLFALVHHEDPAIREAAIEALPVEEPWLDAMRDALADPDEAVVLAAASQLLAGPEVDSEYAVRLLMERDRARLIERVYVLPPQRGLPVLVAALEDSQWVERATRAARNLPHRLEGATAETRHAYAQALKPYVRDPNWNTPDDRRALLLAAAQLSRDAVSDLLREAVLDDPVQAVREAALVSLLEFAGAADVPLLLEVLDQSNEASTQVKIIQFFEANERLVAEDGVVDALLPYLERRDGDGLWAEAMLALITWELGPADERVIPAFARAYHRGVARPLSIQPLNFMLAFPTPEAIDVFVSVLTDPQQHSGEHQFVQHFLTRSYFRLPEIRDRLREAWPRMMFQQRVRVAEIVARPYEPEILDASWIDTFINTDWDIVEGVPSIYEDGQMPDEIAVAIAFLADMDLPPNAPEARGVLRAQFPTVADWRRWWRDRRERWIERAEQDYQQRVEQAQQQEDAGDFRPPPRD